MALRPDKDRHCPCPVRRPRKRRSHCKALRLQLLTAAARIMHRVRPLPPPPTTRSRSHGAMLQGLPDAAAPPAVAAGAAAAAADNITLLCSVSARMLTRMSCGPRRRAVCLSCAASNANCASFAAAGAGRRLRHCSKLE